MTATFMKTPVKRVVDRGSFNDSRATHDEDADEDYVPASTRKVTRYDNSEGATSSDGKLREFIKRIETLEDDKRAVSEDIKEVYAEAKSSGFDPKVLRAVIVRRRQDLTKVQEFEGLLDLYLTRLGYK